jgi:hypothetical protein
VQLGPLGTATTNRPIVPAPGNYDEEIGGMINRGNRSARRKPAPVSERAKTAHALDSAANVIRHLSLLHCLNVTIKDDVCRNFKKHRTVTSY